MDTHARDRLIQEHRDAIRELEAEAAEEAASKGWPPSGFYLLGHLVVGMTVGGIAAVVSLLANVVGAPLFGSRPMELIRVYLTFPMGEQALQVEEAAVLTIGCILYLATGAAFGILLHLIFAVYFPKARPGKVFLLATGFGLALWVLNFYLILSWLQPMLLGGNWIVRMIPPWVGALTHLAFTWTVAAAEVWGGLRTYRAPTLEGAES